MSKASVILSQQDEIVKKDKLAQTPHGKIFKDLLSYRTIEPIPNIVIWKMGAEYSKTTPIIFVTYIKRWLRLSMAYSNKRGI